MELNSKTRTLGDGYSIHAVPKAHIVYLSIRHHANVIGTAQFLTDYTDVGCITHIDIHHDHIGHIFSDGLTLAESMINFMTHIQHKLRFILNSSEHTNNLANKHLLSHQHHFMLRTCERLPELPNLLSDIKFIIGTMDKTRLPEVLELLQKNAWWQSDLTLERLTRLVQSSQCFIAIQNDEIIAFARVLTDEQSCASLWDVVVDKARRGQSIGLALMHHVFSRPIFFNINTWVLFTETAHNLYRKFGFSCVHDVVHHDFACIRSPDTTQSHI